MGLAAFCSERIVVSICARRFTHDFKRWRPLDFVSRRQHASVIWARVRTFFTYSRAGFSDVAALRSRAGFSDVAALRSRAGFSDVAALHLICADDLFIFLWYRNAR